ncbi:hypothetical protein AB0L00_43375 [Actinoallomurus sp. NPDC052308]|uniref:hypothetical protein n=1 Tax=Actinoallomurus sp. NPDC052308 TaxID=3155530 RepID=UPI003445E456
MPDIRLTGLLATCASALLIAGVCSHQSVFAAAASAAPAAVAPPPPPTPTPTPCPNGEPHPCGASAKEREGVESERTDAKKDKAKADEEIAEAKKKAEKCPPESKECMKELIGGGEEERRDMDKAREGLAGMHPAPSDNASPVMDRACQEFAADLPPKLKESSDSAQLTSLCEAMRS